MALGINCATGESARRTGLPLAGFAMAFASYLGDFDLDAETNRVLDVALEMTLAALGLADDFANGIIALAPCSASNDEWSLAHQQFITARLTPR